MDEEKLKLFLEFIEERQEIYRRRFIENRPPPWTSDEVLQEYHFCNVYRELDAGTQYLLDNIIGEGPRGDVFFNVVVYRLFNRPETFEAMGGYQPVERFNPDRAYRKLVAHEKEGNSIFSPAYRITAHPFVESKSKLENVMYGIIESDMMYNVGEYIEQIDHADSLEEVHEICKLINGAGDFLAYEIVTDLNYGFLPYNENDFVNIGPGAEKGLAHIWEEPEVEHLEWLVENQEDLFERHQLDFFYWNGEEEKRLTLRDFEHSACEFQKYIRGREASNPGLRKYEPEDTNQMTADDFM